MAHSHVWGIGMRRWLPSSHWGGPGGLSQASFEFRGLLNMHLRHFEKLKGRVKQFYLRSFWQIWPFCTTAIIYYFIPCFLMESFVPWTEQWLLLCLFQMYWSYREKCVTLKEEKFIWGLRTEFFFKRILQGASPWNKVAHQVPKCSLKWRQVKHVRFWLLQVLGYCSSADSMLLPTHPETWVQVSASLLCVFCQHLLTE